MEATIKDARKILIIKIIYLRLKLKLTTKGFGINTIINRKNSENH